MFSSIPFLALSVYLIFFTEIPHIYPFIPFVEPRRREEQGTGDEKRPGHCLPVKRQRGLGKLPDLSAVSPIGQGQLVGNHCPRPVVFSNH